MKLLLDTHVLLWCLANPEQLTPSTRKNIESDESIVCVSSVSAWEIALKRGLGKLQSPNDLEEQVNALGFLQLLLSFKDARTYSELPDIHRDPFDRMLVAQAIGADLTIVTRDPEIRKYDVLTMDA